MITSVVAVDPDQPDPAIIDEAAAILRSGGLVAFGTETVYGLGADATNPEAVDRIFTAKGRPATNPLIVHVDGVAGAMTCVAHWPDSAARLADQFWPGPLSLVLPRSDMIPDIVTAGQATVGVRVPGSVVARELIRRVGVPIAAPSANRSNRISPTLASHVLKDLDGRVDLILDSGACGVGIESTVLSLTGEIPTILRPGWVSAEEIAALLGVATAQHTVLLMVDQIASSPGQLTLHYAPRTPAFRFDPATMTSFDPPTNRRWGGILLGSLDQSPPMFDRAATVFVLANPETGASGLYDRLHRLDSLGLDFLVIATSVAADPDWLAILDRVRRATIPWTGTEGSSRVSEL